MNQAKLYLSQIKILNGKIKRRQQEVDDLREAAMSLGGSGLDANKVRTDSPDPDPLATKVSKYVDLEKEIDAMIDEFIDLKHTIIGQIEELTDSKYIDVLFKRYVDCKSFRQISREMNYSEDHTKRLHGQALQEFNNAFDFTITYSDGSKRMPGTRPEKK